MKKFVFTLIGLTVIFMMTGCSGQNDDDGKIVIEVSDDSPYRVPDEETKTESENKSDEETEDNSSVTSGDIKVKPHTDSSDLTAEQLKGGYENLTKYRDEFEEKNMKELKELGFEEEFQNTKNVLEKYKDTDFSKLSSEEFESDYQELNNIAIKFDEFRNAVSEKNKKEN
ncbi:MAG: hypothetical protein IJ583_11670 [Firmicutes bacterium]|nr:hypothetical protein [Bacillota bacterium]